MTTAKRAIGTIARLSLAAAIALAGPASAQTYLYRIPLPGVDATSPASSDPFEVGSYGGPYQSEALQPLTVAKPAVSGGLAPYAYSLSGSVPGMALANGDLTGSPSQPGTYYLALTVTDSAGASQTRDLTVIVTAPQPALALSGGPLPADATTGTAIAPVAYAAANALGTVTFTATGLPSGVTIDHQTGVVSGIPTSTGPHTATITATDSRSPTPSQDSATSAIHVAAPLQVTTASLPGTTVSAAYAAALQATGGRQPLTWSLAGGSLTGTGLSIVNGTLQGVAAAGATGLKFAVTDAAGRTGETPAMDLVAAARPVLAGSYANNNQNRTVNAPITAMTGVTASGGALPRRFVVAGGQLPTGVSVDEATGAVSGTPLNVGAFTATIAVRDANGAVSAAVATVAMTIVGQISLGYPFDQMTAMQVGTAFAAVAPSISGGTAPYTYEVHAGSLPAGVHLDPANGRITSSPAPSAIGQGSFEVKVSDSSPGTKKVGFTSVTWSVMAQIDPDPWTKVASFENSPDPMLVPYISTAAASISALRNPGNNQILGGGKYYGIISNKSPYGNTIKLGFSSPTEVRGLTFYTSGTGTNRPVRVEGCASDCAGSGTWTSLGVANITMPGGWTASWTPTTVSALRLVPAQSSLTDVYLYRLLFAQ